MAVRLWMVRCTKIETSAVQLEQLCPKCASECGITITDDRFQLAMELENVIKENLFNAYSSIRMSNRYEVGVLG